MKYYSSTTFHWNSDAVIKFMPESFLLSFLLYTLRAERSHNLYKDANVLSFWGQMKLTLQVPKRLARTWKPFNCRIYISTLCTLLELVINVLRRWVAGNTRSGISVATVARTCRFLTFRSNNKIISDSVKNSRRSSSAGAEHKLCSAGLEVWRRAVRVRNHSRLLAGTPVSPHAMSLSLL